MSRRAALLALVLLVPGPAVAAAPAPAPITAIRFEGNEVTRPPVMLREIVIAPGDPADPDAIERSRQAIQDLGLFSSVETRQRRVEDGIEVTFVVEEKWYFLPIPRFDANSEGENAYGLSLRWYNVGGLNHTLRGNWTKRDEAKLNKGESTSYSLSYSMPFVLDSPYGVGFSIGHSESPITDPGNYTERIESAGFALSRSFGTGPASQGWNTSLLLNWTDQATEGPAGTPEAYGQATALGLSAHFRDIRYNLYSEDGVSYGATATSAKDGAGSDYSFNRIVGSYERYNLVGARPHQNLNFFASLGSYHGGPVQHTTYDGAFGLGGASLLRAYPGDFVVGDFYYRLGAEYLRPVVADWLRAVVVLEAGNAFEDARNLDDRVYTSLGLGLRMRLTFLVNVEIEAGLAWPLDGGDQRFFASKV